MVGKRKVESEQEVGGEMFGLVRMEDLGDNYTSGADHKSPGERHQIGDIL